MRGLGSFVVLAGAAALLAGCGQKEEAAAPTPAPVAPAPTDAEKQALLATLPAPYNTGDLENGRKTFAFCRSCHTITPDGQNMTGPNLYGVFGRKAASHPDFTYSDALKASAIVWDGPQLDQWLASPRAFLPGNKMAFAGIKDAKDRTDLIAYLKVETGFKP